jgi:hypothetical protein
VLPYTVVVQFCKKHIHVPEPPIYVKMAGLPVISVLTLWSLHTKPPPYDFFKSVWGLPAGTEDPKNKVLDNLPEIGG